MITREADHASRVFVNAFFIDIFFEDPFNRVSQSKKTFDQVLFALSFLIGSCCAANAFAQVADPSIVSKRANQLCGTCHGAHGITSMPRTPHLAGQDQDYLVEQLRHYRSGKRQHEVMTVIAKSLAESELESITAWFSSQRIAIEKAP